MPLPIINHPVYEITLPVSKIHITFRPFVEKERKILLMALESGESLDVMNAILHMLTNCLVKSSKEVEIEDLTTVDVEYFFLHLRAKSIGEIVALNFRCDNVTDTGPCNAIMQVDVDITTVTINNLPKNEIIKLTPTIGIMMKYPGFKSIEHYANLTGLDSMEYIYELLVNSIDYIVDSETVHQSKDFDRDDLIEFIMNLTAQQFNLLQEFLEKMPILTKVVKNVCKKCKYDHTITISGYQSFFV